MNLMTFIRIPMSLIHLEKSHASASPTSKCFFLLNRNAHRIGPGYHGEGRRVTCVRLHILDIFMRITKSFSPIFLHFSVPMFPDD